MNGGQFGIVGGTSASAPLWASLVSHINALNGARAGNFNALLYTTIGPAGALRDITSGNNDTDGLLDGQFQAGPGWDACTGWGAPDGIKLLAALKSPVLSTDASEERRERPWTPFLQCMSFHAVEVYAQRLSCAAAISGDWAAPNQRGP